MDFIALGKQCISGAMKTLEKSSVGIIQFKGSTKNIQTEADLEAEETIVSILRKSGQNLLIVAEESGITKVGENPEIEVYIDPVDGSSYFLVGNKRLCSTSLMFVQRGKVLASFVGDLITGDMYYCDGEFAYINDQKIVFTTEKKGERYMVATYAPKGQRIKEELPKLADIAQEEILVFNNSGPLEQAMIATGQFDAVVDLLPVDLWDYCGTAIAQKAGSIVTTREGTPFRYENIQQTCITARNSEIHRILFDALNR